MQRICLGYTKIFKNKFKSTHCQRLCYLLTIWNCACVSCVCVCVIVCLSEWARGKLVHSRKPWVYVYVINLKQLCSTWIRVYLTHLQLILTCMPINIVPILHSTCSIWYHSTQGIFRCLYLKIRHIMQMSIIHTLYLLWVRPLLFYLFCLASLGQLLFFPTLTLLGYRGLGVFQFYISITLYLLDKH